MQDLRHAGVAGKYPPSIFLLILSSRDHLIRAIGTLIVDGIRVLYYMSIHTECRVRSGGQGAMSILLELT